jgi:hypothetical protein
MGLLYFSLFLKNSAAAASVCKGLAWIIQAELAPPTNPERHSDGHQQKRHGKKCIARESEWLSHKQASSLASWVERAEGDRHLVLTYKRKRRPKWTSQI